MGVLPWRIKTRGEVAQNVTANQTQMKRKRGGQKGNRNARKHGFYSATLGPAEENDVLNIVTLEGVDPEIAFIRVKLQSSLQSDVGNPRVIREASRLLVKWYSANYGLDPTDRRYLKTVVEDLLETASMQQSVGLQSCQKQMAGDETNRVYFNNLIGHPTYEEELLNFRKDSHFYKTNHLRLYRISPPAPTARKNKWQTDETNPVHLNN
jgi:hypothetical protein